MFQCLSHEMRSNRNIDFVPCFRGVKNRTLTRCACNTVIHSYTQFYDLGNQVVKKTGSEEAQAWINALNSDTFLYSLVVIKWMLNLVLHMNSSLLILLKGASTSVTPPDYTCTPDQIHILCQCCLQPMPHRWPDSMTASIPAQKCKFISVWVVEMCKCSPSQAVTGKILLPAVLLPIYNPAWRIELL